MQNFHQNQAHLNRQKINRLRREFHLRENNKRAKMRLTPAQMKKRHNMRQQKLRAMKREQHLDLRRKQEAAAKEEKRRDAENAEAYEKRKLALAETVAALREATRLVETTL